MHECWCARASLRPDWLARGLIANDCIHHRFVCNALTHRPDAKLSRFALHRGEMKKLLIGLSALSNYLVSALSSQFDV